MFGLVRPDFIYDKTFDLYKASEVNTSGAVSYTFALFASDQPCAFRLKEKEAYEGMAGGGTQAVNTPKLYCPSDIQIDERDQIQFQGQRYGIAGVANAMEAGNYQTISLTLLKKE